MHIPWFTRECIHSLKNQGIYTYPENSMWFLHTYPERLYNNTLRQISIHVYPENFRVCVTSTVPFHKNFEACRLHLFVLCIGCQVRQHNEWWRTMAHVDKWTWLICSPCLVDITNGSWYTKIIWPNTVLFVRCLQSSRLRLPINSVVDIMQIILRPYRH